MKKARNARRPTLLFCVLLCGILLSGCVLSVHQLPGEPGEPGWSSWDVVGRIQRGHTSRGSVIERLGAPDNAYVNEDGKEELLWLLQRVDDPGVSLALHVEIENGVVGRFWVE